MWGSSFLAAIPPDSARPSSSVPRSFPPSSRLTSVLLLRTQSSCDHLTLTQLVITLILSSHISHSHTQSSHHVTRTHLVIISSCSHVHSTTLTHIQLHIILFTSPTHIISTDHHPHPLHLSHSYHLNIPRWQAQYPEPLEGAAARVVAAGAAGCPRGRRSTQSLQKGLRRALSPLVPLAVFLVAGAVPRASRRGCGARCRRWCRLLSLWQAQYPEPPEGAAARVVAAGAACCLRGRRSTQSLQKGLRRALSPLVPAGCPRGRRSTQSLQKGLRRALSPLVPLAVLVAGAVPRASKRGCGARCRRWCRWLSAWQAQYPEPPEGAAARVVAAGAAGCPRGRRSTQSLQKGWAAARVVAAGAAGCPRGRRSTQSLQKGLRRALSPLVPLAVLVAGAVPRASRRGCGARCRRWCRWLSSWQAQYPEPPEGGLRRALSPLVPLAVFVAGAVPRASRRGCGARCRRWCRWLSSWQAQYPEPPEGAAARVVAAGAAGCPRGRRSTQSLQKGLRRALSPLVPLAVLVAGAVPRASRRGCGARCRRWCRLLSSSWQAQYPEPPEGAAARVVAAGAAGCPRGRRSTQSLQKGLRRTLSPLVPLAVLVAGAVPRASRRGCGARCRRWCRWLSSAWQAQYPEPPEGAVARVVAAGAAGCLPRGRRSIQSLQKGLPL